MTTAAKAPKTTNGNRNQPARSGCANPSRRATRTTRATLPAANSTSTRRAARSETPNTHQLALISQNISGDLSMYGWPFRVSPTRSPERRISQATVR